MVFDRHRRQGRGRHCELTFCDSHLTFVKKVVCLFAHFGPGVAPRAPSSAEIARFKPVEAGTTNDNADLLAIPSGKLQSPTRRGQVHVFGQRPCRISNGSRRKMDRTQDLAVLLAIPTEGVTSANRRGILLWCVKKQFEALRSGRPSMLLNSRSRRFVPGLAVCLLAAAAFGQVGPAEVVRVASGFDKRAFSYQIELGKRTRDVSRLSAHTIHRPWQAPCRRITRSRGVVPAQGHRARINAAAGGDLPAHPGRRF